MWVASPSIPVATWMIYYIFTCIDLFDKTSELLLGGGPSHDVIIKTIYYLQYITSGCICLCTYIYIYLWDIFLHIFCVAFLLNPSPPNPCLLSSFQDRTCRAMIDPRSSGYCECGGGRIIRKPGCTHGEWAEPFTCHDECAGWGFQKDGMMWKMEVLQICETKSIYLKERMSTDV